MSSTSAVPYGRAPVHVVQVLGGGARARAQVRALAAGLVARGLRVTVCAPGGAGPDGPGGGSTGAPAVPLPRRTDAAAAAVLRAVCADADVVHAHGLRAGALAALALCGRRHPPLVVTWHGRTRAAGLRARLLPLLERRVVRAARVVLGTAPELVERARRHGARDVRLAPAVPPPAPGAADGADGAREKTRAELGVTGRPLVLALGGLTPHRGLTALLTASRAWGCLDPVPLLAVVGEGSGRGALQRRVDAEGLPVRLLGRREDVPELLAAADVVVLPGHRAERSPEAVEALRAQAPLVVAGPPGAAGGGALPVPYGDADALAAVVTGLLAGPGRRRTPFGGEASGAGDDAVARVLNVYDELTRV
ncbi:glycosyltransferase [Streptomyces sp. TRM 70361]|uniref:glycosyltransferase n=1 Tax=Streptomyces sp. TRM 70361 TaxID=3116553 RepID=UPI002E7B47C2|nr:glycosyltransferase [Streptomyces sp. TRM 70361]MEE1943230.1 glycosyltransferase [Streptomyces sp. TRM 70361]